MEFHQNDTALVVIDPQNDVLNENGLSWGLVGDSIKDNNTVEHLAQLFSAAKTHNYGVFISPHYLTFTRTIRRGNSEVSSNT